MFRFGHTAYENISALRTASLNFIGNFLVEIVRFRRRALAVGEPHDPEAISQTGISRRGYHLREIILALVTIIA
jgi:hypothetical protein